ncbi:MAG: LLM class flavin-dependent oxidoreductase [Gammaproteobacteria bacterium]
MQFGLSFLPDVSPAEKSAQEYYAEVLQLCDLAESCGFDFIKMTEHYLHSYGGYCPSPLTFLSAVAARTRKIRLMTGCILPVFHHPLQIASTVAMVDALSSGRLEVGFARAYLPYEFQAFNIDMDQSRERFVAIIDAVKKLWTESNVSIESPFFKFHKANSLPMTVQKPYPPLWCAAVNARQSFSWIGERGYGLLITPPPGPIESLHNKITIYREAFYEKHGVANLKPRIALSLPICLDTDNARAITIGDRYLEKYMQVWSNAAESWSSKESSDYPGYTGLVNVLRANSPAKMRENGQALVGDPLKVIDSIKFIQSTLNVDMILLQIDYGGQPLSVAKNTLNLFIDNVRHHFI